MGIGRLENGIGGVRGFAGEDEAACGDEVEDSQRKRNVANARGLAGSGFRIDSGRVAGRNVAQPMKLRIRATPNAKQSEILGWEDDPTAGRVLRVRVAAPPVEGKANAELRGFLAKTLGVPKSQVLLDKGGTSRVKVFEVPDDAKLP